MCSQGLQSLPYKRRGKGLRLGKWYRSQRSSPKDIQKACKQSLWAQLFPFKTHILPGASLWWFAPLSPVTGETEEEDRDLRPALAKANGTCKNKPVDGAYL
jgi:hypothetical protein